MMDKRTWLVLVAVLVGCGGVAEESPGESASGGSGGNTGGSGGAAATGGSGGTAGTDAGTPIWPGDAIRLHATNSGGGEIPQPPPGSTCTVGAADYTLEVASRTLSWTRCASGDTSDDPWADVSGTGTLTEAQYATIEEAMLGLSVYEGDMCGADKPMLQVEVTTPEGTTAYHDNFYACLGGDYTYVENIDAVFVALGALTE